MITSRVIAMVIGMAIGMIFTIPFITVMPTHIDMATIVSEDITAAGM